MSAAVTIVASATMKTRSAVKATTTSMETSPAAESTSTTMTTALGKGGLWQAAEQCKRDAYAKNS
jgi:hypothetical protein